MTASDIFGAFAGVAANAWLKFALAYLSYLAVHQLSTDLEQPPDQLVVHQLHYITEIGRNSQPKTPGAWTVKFNLHLYGSGLDLTPARLQQSQSWGGVMALVAPTAISNRAHSAES